MSAEGLGEGLELGLGFGPTSTITETSDKKGPGKTDGETQISKTDRQTQTGR